MSARNCNTFCTRLAPSARLKTYQRLNPSAQLQTHQRGAYERSLAVDGAAYLFLMCLIFLIIAPKTEF